MNEVLIERHNSRIDKNDNVFLLGDIKLSSFGLNFHEIRSRLNGNLIIVGGNHDKNNGVNTPIRHIVINSYGKNILLVHKPADAQIIMQHYGTIDLAFVGHVHIAWKFKSEEFGDMVNVGVDQWDFYPVDAKQILKSYKKWKGERN